MKRNLLKTLLAAVCLLVGQSASWATDVTTTIDFSSISANPTLSSSAHHKAGNTSNVYLATDAVYSNYLCLQEVNASNNVFKINNNQLINYKGDRWMSLVNLTAGDRITLTYTWTAAGSSTSDGFTIQNSGTSSTTNLSLTDGGDAITAGTNVVSETTYYVLEDGYVDFKTRKNFYLSKIEITTTVSSETVSSPTISITGANEGARTITIDSPKTTLNNASVAYYTIDGTTPSSSSTLYSGTFTVSSSDDTDSDGYVEVKAISYKDGDTSIASEVTTLNVEVGTTIQLDAPTITLSGMTLNGTFYNPQYSFTAEQTVIGTPTATITYSFAGGASTEGTSYTPTAAGTLTVTASADGYNSNSTNLVISNAEYAILSTIDMSDEDYVDVTGWTGYENAHWANFSTMSTTLYTLPETTSLPNVTVNNVTYSQFGLGYGLGFSSGTRTVTVNAAAAGQIGEYVLYTGASLEDAYNSSVFVPYSSGISYTIPTTGKSKALKKIIIYSPAVAVEIGSTGWATFSDATNILDFSSVDGLTAYQITGYSGTTVTKSAIDAPVAAGTGLLLNGTASTTYYVPIAASATADVNDNLLVAGTGAAISAESGKTKYVLGLNGSAAEFQKIVEDAATVPVGKAYLQFNVEIGARNLTFDDVEATGINQIDNGQLTIDNSYYNIAGQRIAQPSKGLYIVNGKKVVVK